MNIIDLIMKHAGVDAEFIANAEKYSRTQIKQIIIKKREEGKFRVIRIPCVESKLIQYSIIDILSPKIKISTAATAYFPGASIKKNALIHSANDYFLRIDLKDFFPSIKIEDFKIALENNDIKLDPDSWKLIAKTCFDKRDTLSIGFPISPFVCNIVMKSFDEKTKGKLEEIGGIDFSRYSDDIIISSKSIELLNLAKSTVIKIIEESESPKITINYKKLRKMSVARGNAIITGVKIKQSHAITIHPNIKNDVVFLLNLSAKRKINTESAMRLFGLMNYIKSVDPDLYNMLRIKHASGYAYANLQLPNKHKLNLDGI